MSREQNDKGRSSALSLEDEHPRQSKSKSQGPGVEVSLARARGKRLCTCTARVPQWVRESGRRCAQQAAQIMKGLIAHCRTFGSRSEHSWRPRKQRRAKV